MQKAMHPAISIIPTTHVWEESIPRAAPALQINRKEMRCGISGTFFETRYDLASSFVDKSAPKSNMDKEKKKTFSRLRLSSLFLKSAEVGTGILRIGGIVVSLGYLSHKLHQKVFKPGLVVRLKLLQLLQVLFNGARIA